MKKEPEGVGLPRASFRSRPHIRWRVSVVSNKENLQTIFSIVVQRGRGERKKIVFEYDPLV